MKLEQLIAEKYKELATLEMEVSELRGETDILEQQIKRVKLELQAMQHAMSVWLENSGRSRIQQ